MSLFAPFLGQDALEQLKENHSPASLTTKELLMICAGFAVAIVISISVAIRLSKTKKRAHPRSSPRRHGRHHRRPSETKPFTSIKETGGLPPRRDGQDSMRPPP